MEIRLPATATHLLTVIRQREKAILSILICRMEIHCQVLRENQNWSQIPDDMESFANMLWESLNEDNKVSLFVRYIEIETGKYETKIINKNQR